VEVDPGRHLYVVVAHLAEAALHGLKGALHVENLLDLVLCKV